MAKGMGQFQLRGEKHGLQSLEDLDQYCYYVAGVVGQMLTRLFCLHSPEVAKHHDALMALAVSFGQGLQMTNILKDVWEDYQHGACWLPRKVFADEGFDLSELNDSAKPARVRAWRSASNRHRASTPKKRLSLYLTHPETGNRHP